MRNSNAKNLPTSIASSVGLAMLVSCGGAEQPADRAEVDAGLGIPSGTYAVDKTHTYVTFSYLHQGLSYPVIRVTEVDGELELDAAAIENSRANIAIRVDSIRTNTSYFDEELASPKFFNAGKYPDITFATDSFDPVTEFAGKLNGRVTIRGITRPLVLDVTINGAIENPITNVPVIGVSASGTLNRSDFDLDRFIPAVADRVDIAIEAEFSAGSNETSAAAAERARSAGAADADSD